MIRQVTNTEQLLRRYEEGRITAKGLILTVLSVPGKQRLTKTLEALPVDILEQLKDFVASYKPGMRVFHGPRPTEQAIGFVREWFNRAAKTVQISKKRNLRKSGTS